MKKRLSCAALPLLALFVLSACARTVKIDTSGWQSYRFEDLGIVMQLPADLVLDTARDRLVTGSSSDLLLTIRETDELYADMESLAVGVSGGEEGRAEILTIHDAVLVRSFPAQKPSGVQYDLIGPGGDAYQISLSWTDSAGEKRGKAILSTVEESIAAGASDGAQAIQIANPAALLNTDYLVLVNKRRALPEGWSASVDLAQTRNSQGIPVTVERAACKSFFALQRALASEGVSIGLDSAYQATSEYCTGLALDLALNIDGTEVRAHDELLQYPELWAKVHARLAEHGFILRCPADGTYDTGCDYEPWHIRYVGAEAAREIAGRGITLEEYLGADPAAIDYLVLVNPHTALPEAWEDAVEIVYMTNRHGEEIGVERTAYTAYCRLRDALAEDGVHLDINSAYRSVAAQQALSDSYLKKYGRDYVNAYVAVPGYSEHHTGLALDLYLESVDVWAKIHARLAEFGFILRYPEGKEAITGYAYEPWHVRYVGTEAAREIASRGITLEEYLDAA